MGKCKCNQANVYFEKIHEDAVIPKYAHPGDAGVDLVAVEDTIIAPGETVLVKTGLKMAMDPGIEAQIRPRSGIASKTKLRVVNTPGTIDSNYRGEVMVAIENTSIDFVLIADELGIVYTEGNAVSELYPVGKDDPEFKFKKNANGSYIIRKGDRIAQMIITKVCDMIPQEVDDINEFDSERGDGGFGSSGVN